MHPSPACTIWYLYILLSLHCKNLSDPMCRTKFCLSLLCSILGLWTVFASQNCPIAVHSLELSLSLNGLHFGNTVSMSELHGPSLTLLSIPFRSTESHKANVNHPNYENSSISLSPWPQSFLSVYWEGLSTLPSQEYFWKDYVPGSHMNLPSRSFLVFLFPQLNKKERKNKIEAHIQNLSELLEHFFLFYLCIYSDLFI